MQDSLVCILEAGSLPVEEERVLASAGLTLRYGNTLGGPVSEASILYLLFRTHLHSFKLLRLFAGLFALLSRRHCGFSERRRLQADSQL